MVLNVRLPTLTPPASTLIAAPDAGVPKVTLSPLVNDWLAVPFHQLVLEVFHVPAAS